MRKNIVNVLHREPIGTKIGYDFYNPDGTPVLESEYEAIAYSDWHKVEMSYEDLCKDLGFIPEAHFVDVTKSGTIYGTFGKPEDFLALRIAVRDNGYKMKSRKHANR